MGTDFGFNVSAVMSVREHVEWFAGRLDCEVWEEGFAGRDDLHISAFSDVGEEYGDWWVEKFGDEPFIVSTFRIPSTHTVNQYFRDIRRIIGAVTEFFAEHPTAYGYLDSPDGGYILVQRFEGEPITLHPTWVDWAAPEGERDDPELAAIAAPYTTAPIRQVFMGE